MRQDLERVLDGRQLGRDEREVTVVQRLLDLRRQRRPVVRLLQSSDGRLEKQIKVVRHTRPIKRKKAFHSGGLGEKAHLKDSRRILIMLERH